MRSRHGGGVLKRHDETLNSRAARVGTRTRPAKIGVVEILNSRERAHVGDRRRGLRIGNGEQPSEKNNFCGEN